MGSLDKAEVARNRVMALTRDADGGRQKATALYLIRPSSGCLCQAWTSDFPIVLATTQNLADIMAFRLNNDNKLEQNKLEQNNTQASAGYVFQMSAWEPPPRSSFQVYTP